MGCVQETLFDKALLEGQGSLKFHYSARRPLATQKLRKKYEIFIPKFGRQSAEKKTACDNGDLGETNPVLLALAVPEVGMFMRKISCCPQGAPESSIDGHCEVLAAGECRRMDNFPIAGDLTAPFSLSCCHPEPKAKDPQLPFPSPPGQNSITSQGTRGTGSVWPKTALAPAAYPFRGMVRKVHRSTFPAEVPMLSLSGI